jgi:benzoate/toluate 1,2-dioxygenase beta subunit
MSAPVTAHTGQLAPTDPAAVVLVAQVHDLLAREAQLLDDRDHERWLELFTDDCLYWMPVDPLATDGSLRLNIFYDDRAKLRDRIRRLSSGEAYTEDPPSLTVRTVSAVQVRVDGDAIVVASNFTLVAHRLGTQRLLAGRYRHRLVRVDGLLRIAEKRVGLLGSDAPQRAMTFLF